MKWLLRILGAVLILALLGLLTLFLMSKRPSAGKSETSVEISQPPEVVWAWITETDKLTQWVDWLVAIESDTTSPQGVGHREVWVMNDPNTKEQMRLSALVTAVDPPRSTTARLEVPKAFVGDVTFTLTPLEGGRTRLTQKGEFQYTNRVYALMEPLVTPEAKKKEVSDFARLKRLAEAAPR